MSQTLLAPSPASTDLQPFVESNDLLADAGALHRRYRRDGYLFFRGLLPRADVMNLRLCILEICQKAGWLRAGTPIIEGICDRAPLVEGEPPYMDVYEKVQRLEEFHRLKFHPRLVSLMESLFQEPVFPLPMSIARIAFPRDNARATQPHQDWLYVQGSTETVSCWIPVGDIAAEVGGLKVLAGSHKAGFLVPRPSLGPGGNTVPIDPSLSWVASAYRAGDVLLFHQLTVHGARENHTDDRLRLSVDFRFVGTSHTINEHWLKPHFHWQGERFSWDNLDQHWKDQSLRRYWERGPKMKTAPVENRFYAKA